MKLHDWRIFLLIVPPQMIARNVNATPTNHTETITESLESKHTVSCCQHTKLALMNDEW
jgi:hypothetical protein